MNIQVETEADLYYVTHDPGRTKKYVNKTLKYRRKMD